MIRTLANPTGPLRACEELPRDSEARDQVPIRNFLALHAYIPTLASEISQLLPSKGPESRRSSVNLHRLKRGSYGR